MNYIAAGAAIGLVIVAYAFYPPWAEPVRLSRYVLAAVAALGAIIWAFTAIVQGPA